MMPNYYQSLLLDLNHEDQTQLNGHYLTLKHQEVDVIFHGAPSYTALEVKREDKHHNQSCSSRSSVKWMSSKTRFLRKMMMTSSATNPKKFKFENDHNFKHVTSPKERSAENSTDNNFPPIRICADCKTTTTPLWRSGPQGPKSLCNACGIRQRKARRAAMAAASGIACTSNNNNTRKLNLHKETGSKQTKKRPKSCAKPVIGNPTRIRKLCFEEFALRLSKKLSLHHVFPPDEKDAAILLMALSCGLVEG